MRFILAVNRSIIPDVEEDVRQSLYENATLAELPEKSHFRQFQISTDKRGSSHLWLLSRSRVIITAR